MAIIQITTDFDAPIETVTKHARTPKLLEYVTRGLVAFRPINPPSFPDAWAERDYLAELLLFGWLPIGKQTLGIEFLPPEAGKFFIRDNGHSATIKKWDHLVTLEALSDQKTRYTDQLELDAGWRTPVVGTFARYFYGYRQKRWKRLIANGFDYAK